MRHHTKLVSHTLGLLKMQVPQANHGFQQDSNPGPRMGNQRLIHYDNLTQLKGLSLQTLVEDNLLNPVSKVLHVENPSRNSAIEGENNALVVDLPDNRSRVTGH